MALLLMLGCHEGAVEEVDFDEAAEPLCELRQHRPGPWSVLEPEWRPSGTQPYNACVVDEDVGDDGRIEQRFVRTFEGALRVQSEHFNMPEEERYYLFTYRYDEAGRRIEAYKAGLGYVGRETFVYDEAGRLTERRDDFGADGSVNERTRYTYGPDWVRSEDVREDGTVGTSRVYHYDARKRLVHIEDFSATGELWATMDIDYEDCLPIRRVSVYGDETIGQTQLWTWSEEGHLLTDWHDYDGDGEADSELGFAYDSEGRVVEKWRDVDGDGQANTRWTFAYCD